MYDTILVPTDGSSDAKTGANHAIGLAAALGSTIHAVYVIQEGTNPWNAQSLDDQLDEARAYGDEVTGEVAAMAADAGVECVTDTLVGPAVHEELNEYVEEEDVDSIIMGSGFRGRMAGVLGSTADKILRTAEVPVTVLRRGETD